MTALTFTLKVALAQRVDCTPLTPDNLEGETLEDIAATALQYGNRSVRADSLFDISGDDSDTVRFVNASDKLDYIGRHATYGRIEVDGNAGAYLGRHLNGATLEVSGNVGAYAACEMKKGQIMIRGNAGDFLGAALPGSTNGMAGGVVVVKGNVGDRAGERLRRGALLIEGNAGDYLGSRMIAGTIAVQGAVGAHLGYAMNRGTLLLLQTPAAIPPTFNDCGSHTLGFLPLLLKSFQGIDSAFAALAGRLNRVQRYAGDLSGLGKGEILVALAH